MRHGLGAQSVQGALFYSYQVSMPVCVRPTRALLAGQNLRLTWKDDTICEDEVIVRAFEDRSCGRTGRPSDATRRAVLGLWLARFPGAQPVVYLSVHCHCVAIVTWSRSDSDFIGAARGILRAGSAGTPLATTQHRVSRGGALPRFRRMGQPKNRVRGSPQVTTPRRAIADKGLVLFGSGWDGRQEDSA
jgi:hypothetical protein